MKKIIFSALAILIVSLAACARVTATPMIAPPVPAELVNLPKDGRIICNDGGDVTLWGLPGEEPGDKNSASYSDRGNIIGYAKSCERVVMVETAWSSWDRVYYVLVEVRGERGWVDETLLELSRKPTTTPTL